MSILTMIAFDRYCPDKNNDSVEHGSAEKRHQDIHDQHGYQAKGALLYRLAQIHNDEISGNHAAARVPTRQDAMAAAVRLACMINVDSFAMGYRDMGQCPPLAASAGVHQVRRIESGGWSALYRVWLPSTLRFIQSFSDPLRLPCAEGAALTTAPAPTLAPTRALALRSTIPSVIQAATNRWDPDQDGLAILFDLHGAIADAVPCQEDARRIVIAIEMLMSDVEQTNALAQLIFLPPDDENDNTSAEDETIVETSRAIVHRWITLQLYNDMVFEYIIKHITKESDSAEITLSDIDAALQKKVNLIFPNDENAAIKHYKQYVLHNIVGPEFPYGLTASSSHGEDDVVLWGITHAGLAYAARTGSQVSDFTNEEGNALGQMIYAMYKEDLLPPSYVSLFSLPAMKSYRRSAPDEMLRWSSTTRESIEAAALAHFFSRQDAFVNENDPLEALNQSLMNYKTRLELDDSRESYTSEELDRVLSEQNKKITEKFRLADFSLISIGFSCLSQDEQAFIEAAEIQIGKFALIKKRNSGHWGAVMPALSHNPDSVTIINNPLNVDVFSAQKSPDSVRIYALQGMQGHYQIKRVDTIAARYQELLSEADQALFEEGFRVLLKYSPHGTIGSSQWGTLRLTERLAGLHETIFSERLHKAGYDTTFLEKTREFFLSLIPFFSCVDSIEMRHGGSAIFNCGNDMLVMAPFIGQAVKVSANVGTILGKGGLVAGRNAMIKASLAHHARFSLKELMRTAGRDFQRFGIGPALDRLGKKELIALGIAAARGVDPGLESLYKVHHLAVVQFKALGHRMQGSITGLAGALVKLEKTAAVNLRRATLVKKNAVGADVFGRGQLLAMQRGNGGYTFFPPAPTPLQIGQIPYIWQPVETFMPLALHQARPESMVRDLIDTGIKLAFYDKPVVMVKGLRPTTKLNAHPYLLEAQSQVKSGFESVFSLLADAYDFLKESKKDPVKLTRLLIISSGRLA